MSIGNHPAFPCEAQGDRSVPQEHDYIQTGIYSGKFPGLMIRDWFAGQALVGGMANADPDNFSTPEQCAAMAYAIADAMLAERSKATVAPVDHSKTLLNALTGLSDILATAESNASGNPEWEYVSARINAARKAIAAATGEAK